MIYKRYELSLSQNGDKLVHIARNAAGNVVFRESSEGNLKKAIDRSIEEKARLEEQETKRKAEHAKVRMQKKKLFASTPPSVPEPQPEKKNFWDRLK